MSWTLTIIRFYGVLQSMSYFMMPCTYTRMASKTKLVGAREWRKKKIVNERICARINLKCTFYVYHTENAIKYKP